MNDFSSDKIVITGGTGTFGNAFIYRCLKNNWFSKITIFSRDEYKHHHMKMKLVRDFGTNIINKKIRFFIGDVRDRNRLIFAFRGATHIIHAAALKHVKLCEYNPQEAIKTNILGLSTIY